MEISSEPMEQELNVLLDSQSSTPEADNASNDEGVGGSQRLECGCPRHQHRIQDTKSIVTSISLSHTVVQDPSQVLESLPKFRKSVEERLFLLDVWLRRPALYYTGELIHAYIDAFSPVRLVAGQALVKEREVISRCYVVYRGSLRQLKDHPAPCTHRYQMGSLDCGAEIFYDSLKANQPSPWSCVAAEDSQLFSLALKDLANLTAAMNEYRRGAFLDCLRAIKYLRPLPAKELHALAESWDEPMKTFDYETGYQLQEQGAVSNYLYYILAGKVDLTDGTVSERRGPGETVCAPALMHLPSPYRATVVELSTLISLDMQLCANSVRERLARDQDGLARLVEELRAELVHEDFKSTAKVATEAGTTELLAASATVAPAALTPADVAPVAAAPAAAPAAVDSAALASLTAGPSVDAQSNLVKLHTIHRRAILRLCRVPQLRGLLLPTELEGLLSDKVQKTTQILARQKNECLYAAGIDYAKFVYVVMEGELRETAPEGPDGSHALLRDVAKGGCACTESLLLLSACLCPRSAYANTACTAVALDVDAMEATLCHTFISVMKRRPDTFRQCVAAQFSASTMTKNELAFRDEVFPRDVGSSDFQLVEDAEDRLPFYALAVLRLVVDQLQLLMEPLGGALDANEIRSLRHCYRAVILGGGRSGGRFAAGETVVTEEESRRRILYFVRSGEAVVVHTRGSRPAAVAADCCERPETRGAWSFLCPEQLFLTGVCCYEAKATRSDTRVALVNQHVLETAMGCEFRDIFLRQPDAFRAFLAARYPGLTEAELQMMTDPSQDSQDRRAGRVYAFGLEALLCHQQLGRLFTDKELQRLRAAPSNVMPCILEKGPNQSIFLQGADQVTNLYVVYTGRVTTTVTPGPNRPKQLLGTHEPGDLLGTESLFRAGIRSTSAYAACATQVIVMAVDKLETTVGAAVSDVLARNPDTMRAVFRQVFQPSTPLPDDGWRPGVDPQQLLTEVKDPRPTEGRQRGRHLRVEAQILREAEGTGGGSGGGGGGGGSSSGGGGRSSQLLDEMALPGASSHPT